MKTSGCENGSEKARNGRYYGSEFSKEKEGYVRKGRAVLLYGWPEFPFWPGCPWSPGLGSPLLPEVLGGLLLLFPSDVAGGLLLALLSAKTEGMNVDANTATSKTRPNTRIFNHFTSIG